MALDGDDRLPRLGGRGEAALDEDPAVDRRNALEMIAHGYPARLIQPGDLVDGQDRNTRAMARRPARRPRGRSGRQPGAARRRRAGIDDCGSRVKPWRSLMRAVPGDDEGGRHAEGPVR